MHGVIFPFAGSAAPNGFLLCYGQAVSRTTYAALFAAIGTTHGAGDGSTTFNVPDLRGRTIAGMDNMGGTAANRLTTGGSGVAGTTLGAAGGVETHTLTSTQMPVHNHSVTDPGHGHSYTSPYRAGWEASGSGTGIVGNTTGGTTASVGTGISIQNAGSGAAHNNTQPTIVLNWIIKT